MRSRRIVPMLVALGLVTIAGCGQPQRQSSGLTPAQPLQPIRYTQTGGLAGTSDQMIVSPDGTVAITGPLWGDRSGRLSPEQMSALPTAFQGWDALRDRYPAVPGVTDPFDLRLTYGGKTVLATDASDVPASFRRAQMVLDGLIRQFPANAATQPAPATPPAPSTTRTGDTVGMPARAR
jgi:hypothetical protein